MTAAEQHNFDVLIVGAGLSGIGLACHLKTEMPDKSFTILEARDNMGGTWDLFRYPGIRSDSDMHTLGYSFKPWTNAKAIADGPSILDYIKETAEDYKVADHIKFQQKVVSASWQSDKSSWIVRAEDGAEYRCQYLAMCSGYYRYEAGYTPDFEGIETFNGQIIHPQHWPEDLDYSEKNIVVIGSGATSVTLVPELAKTASSVTMLQRSPTYIVARPAEDKIANKLRKVLPSKIAYRATRWKNVLLQDYFYKLARRKPDLVKSRLIGMSKKQLDPSIDVDTHFTPSYNPWDQRLCLIPDGDLWEALNEGRAKVVTDEIERFVPEGLRLKSGDTLNADIVVTATGLELQFLGNIQLDVDGKVRTPNELLTYKGFMYAGVPNLISIFGYINASWTLKADLAARYLCRLIKEVDRKGASAATPVNQNADLTLSELLDFSSGYVQRSKDKTPLQAAEMPWQMSQDYLKDRRRMKKDPVDDGYLVFTRDGETVPSSVDLRHS